MVDRQSTMVLAVLSNGQTVRIESSRLKTGDSEQDVADITEVFSFDSVRNTILGISSEIKLVIDQIKPHKTTVEFGIETAVEAGHLTALIVKGTATANLKVTLEWDSHREAT